MSANPYANGGRLRKALKMPDFREYAIAVEKPATHRTGNTRVLGKLLRDIMANNMTNFRLFGPDETASTRLSDVYEAT